MEMKVKYGLLPRLTTCKKERLSLRSKSPPLAPGYICTEVENGRKFRSRGVREFDDMPLRYDQCMALADGPNSQKRERVGILTDP
jgi:hypothetical protein